MIYIIISTVFILLGLLLLGIREGLVIKDLLDNKPSPKESKQWHLIGFFARGSFILAITSMWLLFGFLWLSLIFTILALLLSSVWYNIAINLINGWKWNYLGGGPIDTFLKRLFNKK